MKLSSSGTRRPVGRHASGPTRIAAARPTSRSAYRYWLVWNASQAASRSALSRAPAASISRQAASNADREGSGADTGAARSASARSLSDCLASTSSTVAVGAGSSVTSFAIAAASSMAITALTQFSACRYDRVSARPGDCECVTPRSRTHDSHSAQKPSNASRRPARQYHATHPVPVGGVPPSRTRRDARPAAARKVGGDVVTRSPRGTGRCRLDDGDHLAARVRRVEPRVLSAGRRDQRPTASVRSCPQYTRRTRDNERIPRIDHHELRERPEPDEGAVGARLWRTPRQHRVEYSTGDRDGDPSHRVVPRPLKKHCDHDGSEEHRDARAAREHGGNVRRIGHSDHRVYAAWPCRMRATSHILAPIVTSPSVAGAKGIVRATRPTAVPARRRARAPDRV